MGLFHSHPHADELEQIKFRLAQLENARPIPEVVIEPPPYSPRRTIRRPSPPPSRKVPTWHGELMVKIKTRREKIQPSEDLS